jgi:hydroxymethylglutaryl-CoA reductase
MKLHARSVAASAGVPDGLFEDVVAELISGGDIKVWKATEIVAKKSGRAVEDNPAGTAAGKVILFGEHAVVYGKHALALPITDAVTADIVTGDPEAIVSVPEWGIRQQVLASDGSGIGAVAALVCKELGITDSEYSIHLHSRLPRAMGLGSSAAFAVAIARAFNAKLELDADDARINSIAFECEKLAHGTPSGIDNTIATYNEAMLFRNDVELEIRRLTLKEPVPIVIACSSQPGLTKQQIANVRMRRGQNPEHYAAIFSEMDALAQAGADALASADYAQLGGLMNICHGLLNAIGVSTAELESMVSLARASGATGAKVTGAGGGGSIVALCPGSVVEVSRVLESAGFRTISLA